MTAPVVDGAVSQYVHDCEEFLEDLDESTRAQLRCDIAEIVAEVCSELEGAPADLVGPPFRFVSELRSAAGVPPLRGTGAETVIAASGRHRLLERVRELWNHSAMRWMRTLAPELRPAWWVGRGVLLAWFLGRLTGAGRPAWILGLVPHWPVFGSTIIAVATTAAAVYMSVEAGRRHLTRAKRLAVGAASVVAIVFALSLAGEASRWTSESADWPGYSGPPIHDHPPRMITQVSADGSGFRPVTIGSEVTGDEVAVTDVAAARTLLGRLLADAPPAAIFLNHGGARHQPGTLRGLHELLDTLTADGYLNE